MIRPGTICRRCSSSYDVHPWQECEAFLGRQSAKGRVVRLLPGQEEALRKLLQWALRAGPPRGILGPEIQQVAAKLTGSVQDGQEVKGKQ